MSKMGKHLKRILYALYLLDLFTLGINGFLFCLQTGSRDIYVLGAASTYFFGAIFTGVALCWQKEKIFEFVTGCVAVVSGGHLLIYIYYFSELTPDTLGRLVLLLLVALYSGIKTGIGPLARAIIKGRDLS